MSSSHMVAGSGKAQHHDHEECAGEQDDVRGAPRSGGVARRREHPDAASPAASSRLRLPVAGRARGACFGSGPQRRYRRRVVHVRQLSPLQWFIRNPLYASEPCTRFHAWLRPWRWRRGGSDRRHFPDDVPGGLVRRGARGTASGGAGRRPSIPRTRPAPPAWASPNGPPSAALPFVVGEGRRRHARASTTGGQVGERFRRSPCRPSPRTSGPAPVVPDQERAEDVPRALRLRVAADHELLLEHALELQPRAGAPCSYGEPASFPMIPSQPFSHASRA